MNRQYQLVLSERPKCEYTKLNVSKILRLDREIVAKNFYLFKYIGRVHHRDFKKMNGNGKIMDSSPICFLCRVPGCTGKVSAKNFVLLRLINLNNFKKFIQP